MSAAVTRRGQSLPSILRRHSPRLPVRLDTFRDVCLAQPFATEDQPFGPDSVVFRVAARIFAFLSLREEGPPAIGGAGGFANLKCDPERAVEWRERYAGVVPGWHMSRRPA